MTPNERLLLFIEFCYGSQRALAKAMNFSPQTLSPYILGKSKPGWEILIKLSNVGLSIDWLMTGLGEMFALNNAGQSLKEKWTEKTKQINYNTEFQ